MLAQFYVSLLRFVLGAFVAKGPIFFLSHRGLLQNALFQNWIEVE